MTFIASKKERLSNINYMYINLSEELLIPRYVSEVFID